MGSNDFYIDTQCNDISDFNCEYENFNQYLRFHIDSSVMHYIIDNKTEKLMAYFSLQASALLFGSTVENNAYKAIELKMFAMDKQYKKTGLSLVFLNAIIDIINAYSVKYVGADVILLYSVPVEEVIQLYEKVGFIKAAGIPMLKDKYNSRFNKGCIPMFKVL